MSLHRLGARLTRLEHDARRVVRVADVQEAVVRLMAEASTEIGLAPLSVQELCTACAQIFHRLSPAVPARLSDPQVIEAFMARVTAALIVMLDTHVPDLSTRYGLRQALSQACEREALRREGRMV